MGNLATLKPREVVDFSRASSFVQVRQRGSHKQYRHSDERGTTVPFHSGQDISPTLLRKDRRRCRSNCRAVVGPAVTGGLTPIRPPCVK